MIVNVKIMSRLLFHTILLLPTVLIATMASASISGIPGYSQSETGSNSCHNCHTTSSGAAPNNLTISGNISVLAGSTSTYTITLEAFDSQISYGGFDLSTTGGTLTPANAETKMLNGELVHSDRKATTSGTSEIVQWTFDWQAPTVSGLTTFSACGLPVNGDGSAVKPMCCFSSNDGLAACTTFNILVQQAPLAIAGNNQTVTEGDAVILDASASSDVDGSITTYLWEQLSGTVATISNANTSMASFTAPAVPANTTDELVFRLTVTDNDGLTDTANVSVFVQDALVSNAAPVANAGTDQSVDENTVVLLDASASTDDGSIVAYSWLQTGGFNTVTLSDASIANPDFTAPAVDSSGDSLTFKLTVTDNLGVSATDTVTVTVNDVNTPPTAKITDASGVVISAINNNAQITLYGNFSNDPDGPITAYNWSQTAGAPIIAPGPNNASSFSFTAPDNIGSSIDIQLTVTGDQGFVLNTITASLVLENQPDAIPFTSYNGRPMAISINNLNTASTAVISKLQPIDSASISDNNNRPVSFPYELIDLEVTLSVPGSVLMTLYFPEAIPEGYDAYQYLTNFSWINTTKAKNFDDINFDSIKGWQEITEEAEFSADRRSISFLLTDGGPSDQSPDNLLIAVTTGIGQNQPTIASQPGATGTLAPFSLLLLSLSLCLLRSGSAARRGFNENTNRLPR
jgi:K319L-like, PKD domain